ncbi:MAG: glutamate racemase [Bacteroidia bacterium]|nr:MAG: glutamate racemase [Bacteroidia bacterium]
MSNLNNRPIGVFDSGVGGLTVAHAIKQILPGENLVYFGDTAHLPYGDKSAESIIYYSRRITEFLLSKDAKMVLVACNSASASAFQVLLDEFGDRVFIMDVIEPVVDFIALKNYSRVGVIGTKRTITSGTYEKKFAEKSPATKIISLATPLFVPMIEEGFIFDDISNAIIRSYLSGSVLENIDALVLGCTHYPIIRNQITKLFNFEVEVVDSARVVALKLRSELEMRGLLRSPGKVDDKFFVSDYTPFFHKIARMFFESDIHLERADIWS